MTQQHQPVRAVAVVTPRATAPARPAVLRPARRPDHFGPLHLLQLLVAEAVLVGVVAALTQGLLVVVAAAAGGAILLFTLGRQHGRWWLEQVVLSWQYRRRRGAEPDPRADDPRLAALRVLAPGLAIEDVAVADGSQVGVARDDAGWFAVATVAPGTDRDAGLAAATEPASHRLPLDTLVAALAEAGQPGAVLQAVWHTVPAPSIEVHPDSAASRSYRQLVAAAGGIPVPMDRSIWLAVRLDARALAAAGVSDAELAAAPAVVAGLIRTVAKALRRAGTPCRVNDAASLLGALARSCDLGSPAGPSAPSTPARPREEWSRWQSARLAHRSFWIRDWPPVEHAPALLDWLAATPAAATSVALLLSPGTGGEPADGGLADSGLPDGGLPAGGPADGGPADAGLVDIDGLVRVSAPAAALDPLCQDLISGAAQAHAGLSPLDGQQAPAVYASAPTGGGPR